MRNHGYPMLLEAVGAEASATVREAGSLARRLGHAVVTPLHVASAIIPSSSSSSGSLLRLSGHTFRHEDLKVSLDEALARIPVACPDGAAPLHLSNALVAVLRRAKTIPSQRSSGRVRRRRRRQVAAVKIELQQLVTSMLDDPSVHRAMRKAASVSQLKPNVVEDSNPARPAQPFSGGTLCCQVLDRPVATNITCLMISGSSASQGKPSEVLPSSLAQSGVTTQRASLPSWLHRHQDAILESQGTTIQPIFRQQRFTELSANNFKMMCKALELHVAQHQDIIPDTASTILLCRSGMMRRASSLTSSTTWLIFRGKYFYGKKAMAEELSKLIFGSYTEFSLVKVVDSSRATSNLALKRKSMSQDSDKVYLRKALFEAIQENPHRVVFIDGINQLDYESETVLKNLIATGRITGPNGSDMVILEDTIFVLSSDEASCSRRTTASFPKVYQKIIDKQNRKEDVTEEKAVGSRPFSVDLNASADDMEDEEDKIMANNVGIMSVVDGVFRFD